jgi:hypothetical protein
MKFQRRARKTKSVFMIKSPHSAVPCSRGLSQGSSGNISVRIPDGWLMTPKTRPLDAKQIAELVDEFELDPRLAEGRE